MTKSLDELLKEIEKRAESATPGPYETRCREFSNHAPIEIWTNLGWLDQLPRNYREPTYEFFSHARTDIPKMAAVIRKLMPLLTHGGKLVINAEKDGVNVEFEVDCEELLSQLAKIWEGGE